MHDSPQRQALIGLGCAALAAILFSSKAVVVKLAFRHGVDAPTLLALRMLLSLPFYAGIIWWATRRLPSPRPLSRHEWLAVAALGCCSYYGSSLLDMEGLRYIPANLERLILYLYPTLVLILGALWWRRRIGPGEVLCIGIAYLGIAMVFARDMDLHGGEPVLVAGHSLSPILWGSLLVAGAALLFSIYMVGAERYIHSLGGPRFTSLAMLCASAAVLAHFSVVHPWSLLLAQPWQVYAYALGIALFTTVLPSLLSAEGIRRIGAARTSITGTLGPVATMALGFMFLDEPVTQWHVLGMLLVIASILLLSRLRSAG